MDYKRYNVEFQSIQEWHISALKRCQSQSLLHSVAFSPGAMMEVHDFAVDHHQAIADKSFYEIEAMVDFVYRDRGLKRTPIYGIFLKVAGVKHQH